MKFPGTDTILGPEMRSTGEVMGIDRDFPLAFAKAQIGAGTRLPTEPGSALHHRARRGQAGRRSRWRGSLRELGFAHRRHPRHRALSSASTASQADGVNKVHEGRPHCVDAIVNGEIAMVVNTTVGGAGDPRLVLASAARR